MTRYYNNPAPSASTRYTVLSQDSRNSSYTGNSSGDLQVPYSVPRNNVGSTEGLLKGPNGTAQPCQRGAFFRGWRAGASFAALTAFAVMATNITLLVYAVRKYSKKSGLGTLFEGSCERTDYLDMWMHLAINGLGSCLLVASNYTMQILTSPTRKDVDRAHQNREWLDIGIPSVRNLSKIGFAKSTLWGLLAVSSIPMHLLYNSAVLSTVTAYSYQRIVLANHLKEDFLSGKTWTTTKEYIVIRKKEIEIVQRDAKEYEILDKFQCIQEYATQLSTKRRHVLPIVNDTTATEPVVDYGYSRPLEATNLAQQPFDWLCGPMEKGKTCDLGTALERADTWTIKGKNVEYCLSEHVEERCLLQFSTKIMYVVITANAIKAICMLWALFLYRSDPLVTTGDAIDSFLENEDKTTFYFCTAGKKEFKRKGAWRHLINGAQPTDGPVPWKNKSPRWIHAASKRRWATCYLLSSIALGVTIYFLVQAIDSLSQTGIPFRFASLWKMGIKKFDTRAVVASYVQGSAVVFNAIKANAPQMIVSFLYINYNALYTCMLAAREWNAFALSQKPLRVSAPKGNQKSTYFLSLPYKYAVTLIIGSTLLHWLVSQSLFLTRIQIKDYQHVKTNGEVYSYDEVTSACGYAPLFIIAAITLATIMLLIALVLGIGRRYSGQIPLVAGCSAAISAACHATNGASLQGVGKRAIKWGAVEPDHWQGREKMKGGHCTFWWDHVNPPEEGHKYW